jgi:prepilin-type N-terminal cleavage/methylation domain-containing protein
MGSRKPRTAHGFTIVELLVVIVVIGILAAITIVSYTGITNRANIAVLQSDLSNASQRLKIYQATYGSYPTALNTSNCPTTPTVDNTLCLKPSASNTYTYTSNGITFSLVETNTNGMVYNVTDNTAVAVGDPWANWYSGIAATALASKHVYKTDLGSIYAYKTTNDAVASPQGATGLDPNYLSNMVLVSPQTNPGVDFSAYPAQNACEAISGRLPNMQELLAIYAGRATYGNNFPADDYWSSTEYNSSTASTAYFGDGSTSHYNKTDRANVRCVAG